MRKNRFTLPIVFASIGALINIVVSYFIAYFATGGAFMNGNLPIQDGFGGDFTEYAMLNLRLVEGLNEDKVFETFGHNIPNELYEKSRIFIDNGYMRRTENGIALTRRGFLMSNTILAEIL